MDAFVFHASKSSVLVFAFPFASWGGRNIAALLREAGFSAAAWLWFVEEVTAVAACEAERATMLGTNGTESKSEAAEGSEI